MLITKKSMLTGATHTFDIPVTEDQLRAWQDGELIQRAMPNLTADEREFLMTGITAEEWGNEYLDDEPEWEAEDYSDWEDEE